MVKGEVPLQGGLADLQRVLNQDVDFGGGRTPSRDSACPCSRSLAAASPTRPGAPRRGQGLGPPPPREGERWRALGSRAMRVRRGPRTR